MSEKFEVATLSELELPPLPQSARWEEFPDDAGVLFNLACAESRLGRTDVAIGHLRESIAGDESFRELAQKEADFDAIRDDTRFRELVGTA